MVTYREIVQEARNQAKVVRLLTFGIGKVWFDSMWICSVFTL